MDLNNSALNNNMS